jgi:DNA gyrase subunit B
VRERYVHPEIAALADVDAIRARPALYLGDLGLAGVANLLLQEALCCARDGALIGRCSQASITLHSGRRATVRDDGPGLPLDISSTGSRTAEEYLTKLHARASAKPPEVASSTCILGLAVLNALSSSLMVRVFQDGIEWQQVYALGRATTELAPRGPTTDRGTELSFALDESVLGSASFVFDDLVRWAEHSVRSLALSILDEPDGRQARILATPG